MSTITQGVTYTVTFFMADATDDESSKLGLSPTVYIRKPGGTFTTSTNSATEAGRGYYDVVLTTTEVDTLGEIVIDAEATDCDVWRSIYQVVAANTGPFTVTLTTAQLNAIADTVHRRDLDAIHASAYGDTVGRHSSYGAISKLVNRVDHDEVGSELDVYRKDGTTLLYSQSVTTSVDTVRITGQGV